MIPHILIWTLSDSFLNIWKGQKAGEKFSNVWSQNLKSKKLWYFCGNVVVESGMIPGLHSGLVVDSSAFGARMGAHQFMASSQTELNFIKTALIPL